MTKKLTSLANGRVVLSLEGGYVWHFVNCLELATVYFMQLGLLLFLFEGNGFRNLNCAHFNAISDTKLFDLLMKAIHAFGINCT